MTLFKFHGINYSRNFTSKYIRQQAIKRDDNLDSRQQSFNINSKVFTPPNLQEQFMTRLHQRNLSKSELLKPRPKQIQFQEYNHLTSIPKEFDFNTATYEQLDRLFRSFSQRNLLDEALQVQQNLIRVGRKEAAHYLTQKDFFTTAEKTRNVSAAIRFVQVLPRELARPQTYDMVVSVCAKAGDLINAQHAVDMMKSTGLVMDTRHYAQLIQACANACNHENAFRLYKEMLDHGVQPDRFIYCALITACAKSVQKLQDRPSQLVLMGRAFQLLEDMEKYGVVPDVAVWNALITCSGRVGQLDRAFELLEMMMKKGYVPCKVTYGALIDSCIKSKQKELALKVFRRALQNGFNQETQLYTLAIQACRCDRNAIDLQEAIDIYTEMQRQGAIPDQTFFGTLVLVAGDAGNLDIAFQIHDDMLGEGLVIEKGVSSSLLRTYLINDRLEEGWQLYQQMKAANIMPLLEQCNQMIHALGKAYSLEKLIECLEDMKKKDMVPNQATYGAVLGACRRLGASELALEVIKVMKRSGVAMDKVSCLILLRICYNAIWGEGPERLKALSVEWKSRPEGIALLQALYRGRDQYVPDTSRSVELDWQNMALTYYRDALTAGVKPDGKLLNFLFSCLRLPLVKQTYKTSREKHDMSFYQGSLTYGLEKEGIVYVPMPEEPTLKWRFDLRVKALLQESMSIGVMPHFNLQKECHFDLTEMWPVVAEVYILTVFSHLQQRVQNSAAKTHQYSVRIKVQPFDKSKVLKVSYQGYKENDFGMLDKQETNPATDEQSLFTPNVNDDEEQVDEQNIKNGGGASRIADSPSELVGLGICAQMRRMGLKPLINDKKGVIKVSGSEIIRWSRWWNKTTLEEQYQQFGKTQHFTNLLASQQSQIRMQGDGNNYRGKRKVQKQTKDQ